MPGGLYDTADIPEEALAIAQHFLGEWYNGGLSQFFANWEPEDAALVPTALGNIGFPQGADIVGKAVATMGPQDTWKNVGHQALMNYDSPMGRTLNDFDRELAVHERTFDKAVTDFEFRLAKNTVEEMLE